MGKGGIILCRLQLFLSSCYPRGITALLGPVHLIPGSFHGLGSSKGLLSPGLGPGIDGFQLIFNHINLLLLCSHDPLRCQLVRHALFGEIHLAERKPLLHVQHIHSSSLVPLTGGGEAKVGQVFLLLDIEHALDGSNPQLFEDIGTLLCGQLSIESCQVSLRCCGHLLGSSSTLPAQQSLGFEDFELDGTHGVVKHGNASPALLCKAGGDNRCLVGAIADNQSCQHTAQFVIVLNGSVGKVNARFQNALVLCAKLIEHIGDIVLEETDAVTKGFHLLLHHTSEHTATVCQAVDGRLQFLEPNLSGTHHLPDLLLALSVSLGQLIDYRNATAFPHLNILGQQLVIGLGFVPEGDKLTQRGIRSGSDIGEPVDNRYNILGIIPERQQLCCLFAQIGKLEYVVIGIPL